MQAVILAAGRSRRMGSVTEEIPKCLIKVGGKTILGRMIENLIGAGVDDLIMTVGYLHQQIRDFTSSGFPDLKVTYLLNSDYENNNNSYSLWMTRDEAEGPILLLDSDIVFDSHILDTLINCPRVDCLAVRTSNSLGVEEMKVSLRNSDWMLDRISKEIDPKKAVGESIGIEKFSPDFLKELFKVLNRRISKEGRVNEFYEVSFQEMIDNGHPIYGVDIGSSKAAELDFPEDVKDAETNIVPFIE